MRSRSAAASDGRAAADAAAADPRACFSESLRVFKEINAEGEQACTLRAWAEFELQQGQTDEGRKRAKAARDIFLRLGTASEVERTDAML